MKKRFRILLAVECFIVLALLLLCFRPETRIYTLEGEGINTLNAGENGGNLYTGEYISLKPGVYRVEAEGTTAEGQSILIEPGCEDDKYHALRGNAVTLYPRQDNCSFEIYVADRIDSAYIKCEFFGGGGELLEQLEIYRTAAGNRILLIIIVFTVLMIHLLIELRRRILQGKSVRSSRL